MIYVHNLSGRNIYTKLDDVLQLNDQKDTREQQKEGYENLGNAVDINYKTFTDKMQGLKNKPNFNPYRKPTFVNSPNRINESSVLYNSKKSNNQIAFLNEKSKEEQFLNIFTNAIKNNSDLIKNSNNCIDTINRHFIVKLKKGNEKEDGIDNLHEYNKSKHQKEDLNFIEKINAKVERNRKLYSIDNEIETHHTETQSSQRVQPGRFHKKEESSKNKNGKYLKRLEKILFGALNYLYFNNVTVQDFFKKNPFPKKPFNLKYSFEFFEAVKFNKISDVDELLKKDKAYLFEFDYFHQTPYHWAAKRGYKDMLELLLSRGNHGNQFDNSKRTPLFLAALNNHYDACAVLISYDANPFMDNKEGKKPCEVTTDDSVKTLIQHHMDHRSEMGGASFFKSNVLKKHKADFINMFSKGDKVELK